MRCYECFHYNACNQTGWYVDTKMCKNALPTSEIERLKADLDKANKKIADLQVELDWATHCIDEVEDAIHETDNKNWVIAAINNYRSRYDDSL